VFLNRVAIRPNQRLREVESSDDTYVMYGEMEETVSNLFFTYKVTTTMWNMYNRWIKVRLVQHDQAVNHFQHFSSLELNNKDNLIWKCIWIAST